MLKGHVGKPALHRQQLGVGAAVGQLLRGSQRQRVAAERCGRAARGIARELVEQHDARQRALRPLPVPLAQAASHCLHNERREARLDGGVEGVILAEPFGALLSVTRTARRQEPEIEYILCCHDDPAPALCASIARMGHLERLDALESSHVGGQLRQRSSALF